MSLYIHGIDLDLLEKQRTHLRTLQDDLIAIGLTEGMSQEQIDALEGILNMLDAWSDARYFKKQERDAALATIKEGQTNFTTEQVTARYECNECVEGIPSCNGDCVESRTGSLRCKICGERIWFAYSLSDHSNPFTCPYCGMLQSNKHLES